MLLTEYGYEASQPAWLTALMREKSCLTSLAVSIVVSHEFAAAVTTQRALHVVAVPNLRRLFILEILHDLTHLASTA